MKLTTYIFGGFVASLLIVVGILMTVNLKINRNNDTIKSIEIKGYKNTEITSVKTIQFRMLKDINKYLGYNIDRSKVNITMGDSTPSITYPNTRNLSAEISNDTLVFTLDCRGFHTEEIEQQLADLAEFQYTLKLGNNPLEIETDKKSYFLFNFNDVETDSLTLNVNEFNAELNNCKIKSVNINTGGTLVLNDTNINEMQQNLTERYNNIDLTSTNSSIETLIMRGKNNYYESINKNLVKQVKWIPLTDAASLEIILHQPAVIDLN